MNMFSMNAALAGINLYIFSDKLCKGLSIPIFHIEYASLENDHFISSKSFYAIVIIIFKTNFSGK